MMRKRNPPLIAARQAGKHAEKPEELVCLALMFATIVLALRIASVW